MGVVIPAYIGWLAVVVIIVAFAAAFAAQRRRKARQVPTHWRIPIDGFADVSVTREVSRTRAGLIAFTLEVRRNAVWRKCTEVYKHKPKHPWPVDKIGVVTDPAVMPKDHPRIAWSRGLVKLLIADDMYLWFAHEVHQMFRRQMLGRRWTTKPRTAADAARAVKVQAWIDEEYRT